MQKRTYPYIWAIALLALIWVGAGAASAGMFFNHENLTALCQQTVILSLLAIGLTTILAAGAIDLSIGGAVGLISLAAASLHADILPVFLEGLLPDSAIATKGLLNTGLTLGAVLLLGLSLGAIQGGIIGGSRRSAWIVTLGGMALYRGASLALPQGRMIMPIEPSLRYLTGGYLPRTAGLGLTCITLIALILLPAAQKKIFPALCPSFASPSPRLSSRLLPAILLVAGMGLHLAGLLTNAVVLLAAVALVAHVATGTAGFQHLITSTKRGHTVLLFATMGGLCGLAAILRLGLLAGATTASNQYYEIDSLTACLLGTFLRRPAVVSIGGAILGALLVTSLINGLHLSQIPPAWQMLLRVGLLLALITHHFLTKPTGGTQ